MAKSAESTLTERQQKWFASVREGLERDTGRTLEEWVKIAKKCPETKTQARCLWLKANYGLGVNRAATIFSAAFPSEMSWDDPDALLDTLWKDTSLRRIYEKIETAAKKFDGVTVGPRNSFTAFSRKVQFAAARPYKGAVRLGLAVDSKSSKRLEPAKKSEGWGERLKSSVMLTKASEIDAELKSLLKQAWENS